MRQRHVQREILSFQPSFAELAINRISIERNLGYRQRNVSPAVASAIDDVFAAAPRYVDVQCGAVILPTGSVTFGEDSIQCDSLRLGTERVIAPLLKNAETLAIFVATAGPRLEEWASQLIRSDDVITGYIADTMGSEVAEHAAEYVQVKLTGTAAHYGWKTTNRYSPGYCGWPTSDQHILFSLLPQQFCGIRLNSSALMVPLKSVSGVIGLGPLVRRQGYQCAVCEMEDCFRRKDE
jgi:hypothetical protein